MSKLKIADLEVTSFITGDQKKVSGGVSNISCNGQVTCALACSDTNGRVVCKDPTNITAYFC